MRFFGLTQLATNALLPQIKQVKGIGKLNTALAFKKNVPALFTQQKKALGQIPKLLSAKEAIKLLGTTPIQLLKELHINPEKISQRLGKLNTQQRKQLTEATNEAIGIGTIDTSILSSSWLTYGVFELAGASSGFLTLTTKQGKDYTYPGVEASTWFAMKAAKGKNGSGAGSVFWNQYLRGARSTTGYNFFQQSLQMNAGKV